MYCSWSCLEGWGELRHAMLCRVAFGIISAFAFQVCKKVSRERERERERGKYIAMNSEPSESSCRSYVFLASSLPEEKYKAWLAWTVACRLFLPFGTPVRLAYIFANYGSRRFACVCVCMCVLILLSVSKLFPRKKESKQARLALRL